MMRTRIRHIIARVIPTLAVCIACLVFHGCNSEIENPGVITDDGIVQVGFRIRLGEVTARTPGITGGRYHAAFRL